MQYSRLRIFYEQKRCKKILNKEPSNENEKLFLQKLEYALTEKEQKN